MAYGVTAPVVAVILGGDELPSGISARVESVHHALGSSPSTALITLPMALATDAIVSGSSLFGRTVLVTLSGSTIFYGAVWDVRSGCGQGGDIVEMVAYDERMTLMGMGIGDPDDTTTWNAVGFDVTFNKGGRPDHDGSGGWARGAPGAVFWTVNDILNYIGETIIEPFTGIEWNHDAFSGCAGASGYPGEVALGGAMVGSALDTLCEMLGGVTWGLSMAGVIYPVSLAAADTTRLFTHTVDDVKAEPNAWTVIDWEYVRSGVRAQDRVVVVSGPREVEATFSTNAGTLDRDTSFVSAIYPRKYIPDVTVYSAHGCGANRAADSMGKEWLPELVTRKNAANNGYLTADQHQAAEGLGEPLTDREAVWVSIDQGETYLRLSSGYELAYDPPALLFEPICVALDEGGNEVEIDVATDLDEVILTITTLTEGYLYGLGEHSTGFSVPSRTRYIPRDDLVPRYRYAPQLPDLSTDDPTDRVTGETGAYNDVQTDLDNLAAQVLASRKDVHRELILRLPYPLAVYIGDACGLSDLDGENVIASASAHIITGLDYSFGERDFSMVVRAENQIGAAVSQLMPLASRAIHQWRHGEMFKRGLEMMASFRKAREDLDRARKPGRA